MVLAFALAYHLAPQSYLGRAFGSCQLWDTSGGRGWRERGPVYPLTADLLDLSYLFALGPEADIQADPLRMYTRGARGS